MAVKDVFKITRKTFFDPRGWLGYDLLKEQTVGLWALLKGLFIPAEPTHKETFEEAMQRMRISETDLKQTSENFFMFAILFAVLGGLTVVWGFYILIHHGKIWGLILSLAVAALFFSQAFRYHFWHFQIKFRKLGCTYEEWRQGKPFDKEPTP